MNGMSRIAGRLTAVGLGLFVLGCGVTLYHGVHMVMHPPELHITALPFVVLGISLVVDGVVLWKAVKVVNEKRGDVGFIKFLRGSSDPTLAAVLLEAPRRHRVIDDAHELAEPDLGIADDVGSIVLARVDDRGVVRERVTQRDRLAIDLRIVDGKADQIRE